MNHRIYWVEPLAKGVGVAVGGWAAAVATKQRLNPANIMAIMLPSEVVEARDTGSCAICVEPLGYEQPTINCDPGGPAHWLCLQDLPGGEPELRDPGEGVAVQMARPEPRT